MGYARQASGTLPNSSHRRQASVRSVRPPKDSQAMLEPGGTERKGQAVLACLSYAGCSTLMTLANKAIFSENKLNFPWMLLGAQSIVVTLLLLIYYSATTTQQVVKRELLRQMLLPCTFFTSFIFTNARALRYISLPVLTVVKSLAPMGVALMERVLFQEKVSLDTYGAMVLILSGNAVTVFHDIEFHAVGYMWAGLNVVMNVCYVVSLRYCLSNQFSSGEKTLHSNILACTFIFPMALIFGEWPGFFVEFGKTSLRFRALFLLSCLLAAGIGASVFWVIRTASGSTLSFVGASNKVFVVVLGAILFDAKISGAGWVGVGMGTMAGFWFAFAKSRGSKVAGAREEKAKMVEEDEGGVTSDDVSLDFADASGSSKSVSASE